MIEAYNGNVNLTVLNTYGYGLNPNVVGRTPGRFLTVYKPTNIVVKNCYIESTSGIYLNGDVSAPRSVEIRFNRIRNIDGRKSNGNGGFSADFNHVQFVQLDKMPNAAGIEITWNEVINELYKSRVEDNINLWKSGGTSASPVLIHDNYIQGAYPAEPTQSGYTGGGILLGDDSMSPDNGTDVGFVKAYNNQIVNSAHYGIAITSGHDSEIHNNRIVSTGQLSDGTHLAGGLGVFIWDFYNNIPKGVFYNNFADNNTIGVINGANGYRNDTWFPNCAQGMCTNNQSLPAPLTLNTEKVEYQSWMNKVSSHNVTIGPNF